MFVSLLILLTLIYIATCFAIIAKKKGKNVFIGIGVVFPLLNAFLLPLLAEVKYYWLFVILLFIPVVNIIAVAYLIGEIARSFGKNRWLYGIGCLIPLISFFFLTLLALSKAK